MSLRNYLDKVKRYFPFSKEEWLSFWITVICLAFIYSWTNWGAGKFEFATGIKNLAVAVIFIGITLFVHHAGQRLIALWFGLRAEQKIWWYGLLIGLILTIISNGNIKFLAATGTLAYMLPVHRLGAFRYGPGVNVLAKIVMAGPIANIFFAAIIITMQWVGILSYTIAEPLFKLNLVFAFWNLFPIPPLDGSKIFYYSRNIYMFIFGSFASYVFLIYFFEVYSYIYALLMGIAIWLAYFIFVERKL